LIGPALFSAGSMLTPVVTPQTLVSGNSLKPQEIPACVCSSTGFTLPTSVAQRVRPPLSVLRIDVERSCSRTTIAGRRSSAKFWKPQFASSLGPLSGRGPPSRTSPPVPSGTPPPVPPAPGPPLPARPETPPVPACPVFGATTLALHAAASSAAAAAASSARRRDATSTDPLRASVQFMANP
jgi:hypothetical protein